MTRFKLIFLLAVLLVSNNSQVSAARLAMIQDTYRLGDFANRPAPPVSAEAKRRMEAQLDEARKNFDSNPNDADANIWLGRRLAYLGRFREAIEVYTRGIERFPRDARFYRHRGHRYISVRQFDLAIADFEKAAQLTKGKPDEIEQDGQPNARNIPTSTLQFNIWYHMGLAHYLKGQNKQALKSYRECLKVSKTPDRLVATTHWLYMTLRRLDRVSEADKVLQPISDAMEIIENGSYHRLLLMYKGLVSAEELLKNTLKLESSAASHSILYGIANWYLYNGKRTEAHEVFQRLLASDQWTSFGFIAAEADLKRIQILVH